MEAVLTTLTFWFIAGLIVFILIIISIIGTWFEAREMRKELEQVNAYLATLNDNLIIGFQNNDRQSRNFWEPAALVPAFLSCRSCRPAELVRFSALCCRPCRAVSPLWSLCAPPALCLFLPCGVCALPLHCAVAPAVLFLPCGTCALPCAVFGANCVRNEGVSWAAFPSFWSIESIENIESVEKS